MREALVGDLCGISFNHGSPHHRFIVALYASILELAGDFTIALQHSRYSCLPIILRSVVEAHIDFLILIKSEPNHNYILATFYHDQLRTAKTALAEKPDGARSAPSSQQEWEHFRDTAEAELLRLKNSGYSPLKTRKRFEMAGKPTWYGSVYSILSSHAHNNLLVLARRHFEKGSVNPQPVFEKEWADADVLPLVKQMGFVMSEAYAQIRSFFGRPHDQHLDTLAREFLALCFRRTEG